MGFHPLSVEFYCLFKSTAGWASTLFPLNIITFLKVPQERPFNSQSILLPSLRGGVSREAARGWGLVYPPPASLWWGLPLSQDKPEPRPIDAQAPYTRLHPHDCGKRAAPAGNTRSGP